MCESNEAEGNGHVLTHPADMAAKDIRCVLQFDGVITKGGLVVNLAFTMHWGQGACKAAVCFAEPEAVYFVSSLF